MKSQNNLTNEEKEIFIEFMHKINDYTFFSHT